MLVNHLGYCHCCVLWSVSSYLPSSSLFLSLSLSHTNTHVLFKSNLFYFSTCYHSSFDAFFGQQNSRAHTDTDTHAYLTPNRRINLQWCKFDCPVPAISVHLSSHVTSWCCETISQKANTMWKRIYYIYQNYKLYNCTTTVQIAQMCTCASLIYRYYVPVTLFLMFLSFNPTAFCKERNNKMEALVYYNYDYYWFSPPVRPLMEKDSCTFSWAYSEGCVFCPLNSPWSVQRCGDV